MKDRIEAFILIFSLTVALMLPVSAFIPDRNDCEIYDKIIRLHVIANSDSDSDQELKLTVRDGILGYISQITEGAENIEEAKDAINSRLDEIQALCKKIVKANGSEQSVRVTLTKENYPTREYGEYSLPSGNYTSLRIMLGEAKGHNWWCILFPRLCVANAKKKSISVIKNDEAFTEAGFTGEQIRIITGENPKTVVKFRILEWFSKIFS